jgi:GNAT superfamily N-acetyltransferase
MVMTVYNKKGESLNLVSRFACPDDVPRIISLLKKQHGIGYYPKMYDEAYVKDLIKREQLWVVVVEFEDGTLVGIIGATKDTSFSGSITFSMLVLSPPIRGFGLGKKLHTFLLQTIPIHAYTCVYGYCMTLDIVSQKNHIEFGYHMTGLLPNGYFNDATAEYMEGLSLPVKDVLLVACLPQAKHDAGPLYIPPAYEDYIIGVYISLGVAFTVRDGEDPVSLPSIYTLSDIKEHRYCELIVSKPGNDFKDILDKMLEQYSGLENQSFNAYVNLNDPGCPQACHLLEEQGFFFTGLQPLAGQYEYLLMHYSPSLPVPFDRIAIVSEFKERLDYIYHLYQEAVSWLGRLERRS